MPTGRGALPDLPDARDFSYEAVFGAPVLTVEEWQTGYDVEKEFDIALKLEDQGSSSSCVGQAASKLFELKLIERHGKDALTDYSSRFIYANVSLGLGVGAYIRDGMKFAADSGCADETTVPSYENGKPPSEAYMVRKDDITPEIYMLAKKVDVFNYRVISEAQQIDTIAHAIKTHKGLLIGFQGSNKGWATGIVRPPKLGEAVWGHAVIATRFGKDGIGKWVGGPNSWSAQWGILGGYWKAYEKDYFTVEASQYVFNPWVYVWDTLVPDNQKAMDYIKQHENKLVQNAATGEIGLIKGGEVLITSPERAGLLALTTLIRNGFGGGVADELWQQFPTKKPF